MSKSNLNGGAVGADIRRSLSGVISGRKHYLERLDNKMLYINFVNPEVISPESLLLWYSADKEITYINGNSVSTLTNFGNGVNATPFSAGPTYVTNVLNNYPIYRFDNSAVRTTSAYSLTDWSFFVVFRNTAGFEAFERLVDHDFTNGFWFGRNSTTANSFGGGVREPNPPYGRFTTVTDNAWNIIGNQRNNTTHSVWNNGDWVGRSTGTVTGVPTNTNAISIAGWFNNSSPAQQARNIDIAEVVFYNSALSDIDREKIEGYLAWKYDLTINLPVGHPYKNVTP